MAAADKTGNAAEINASLARGEGLRAAVTMRKRATAAVQNERLRTATKKTTQGFADGRLRAAAAFGAWEELRTTGHNIRSEVVANLDSVLRQFTTNVEAAGGHVHFAHNASDVVRYVCNLAKERGVSKVVKSKSMVSEEVELNQALEAGGHQVVETDLGEYIIQLAGVKPSHLVAPALHMTRQTIADLFSAQTGLPMPTDTPTLTAYARARLREEFLSADMGITGCNFGVAETGTMVLVTNEGNGRMVTSVPRIQVTLMGMERLVATWDQLDVMLNLLPRSATGQKVSTYVSMVTGPRKPGELDGPEELHVVIVDNGRSRLMGTEMQEALHCIRCGGCQNVCPVYREIGGHAYGWVYGGPIGAIVTPMYKDWKRWNDVAYACSVCAACTEACPVQVPLHDLMVTIRRRAAQGEGQPHGKPLPLFTERAGQVATASVTASESVATLGTTSTEHAATQHPEPKPPITVGAVKQIEHWAFKGFALVMTHSGIWQRALPLARVGQLPMVRNGYITKAPLIIGEWTKARDLPRIPARSFRELWQSGEVDKATKPVKPLVKPNATAAVEPDVPNTTAQAEKEASR